jgi:hypothetical protein
MKEPLISKSSRLNLTPTSKGLSLKPDHPRLDFIGTNYDGTTARKEPHVAGIGPPPRNCLDRIWGPVLHGFLHRFLLGL